VSATDVPPPPPGCVWGPALLDGDPPAWCAVTDKGPRMYRDDAWGRAPPLDAGPIYHAAFEAVRLRPVCAALAPDPEHDDAALRGAGLKTLDESYSFRKLGKEPEPLLDRIVDRMDRVLTGMTAEAHEAAFYPGCDVDPGTERANLALDALCRMWLAERAKKLGKE
jgi:hypothetical protein